VVASVSNPGFTLAEDAALKARLSELVLSDDRNVARPVQVFFRFPEGETEKVYPFITIDLLDIAFDPYRQNSEVTHYYTRSNSGASLGLRNMDYYPSEFTQADMDTKVGLNAYLTTDQFVAVDLTYQITTYCRSQRHDRQLTMLLLRRVFPMRRGFIEIPEDGTIRRCDLLDWRQADVLDQETGYKKRTFRKVLTVRINAEIPQSDFEEVQRVLDVNGTLNNYYSDYPDSLPTFTEDF
jgi:hypothetical protein